MLAKEKKWRCIIILIGKYTQLCQVPRNTAGIPGTFSLLVAWLKRTHVPTHFIVNILTNSFDLFIPVLKFNFSCAGRLKICTAYNPVKIPFQSWLVFSNRSIVCFVFQESLRQQEDEWLENDLAAAARDWTWLHRFNRPHQQAEQKPALKVFTRFSSRFPDRVF